MCCIGVGRATHGSPNCKFASQVAVVIGTGEDACQVSIQQLHKVRQPRLKEDLVPTTKTGVEAYNERVFLAFNHSITMMLEEGLLQLVCGEAKAQGRRQ